VVNIHSATGEGEKRTDELRRKLCHQSSQLAVQTLKCVWDVSNSYCAPSRRQRTPHTWPCSPPIHPATHLLSASNTSVGARFSSSSTIQCPLRTACTSNPSWKTSRPLSSLA
jgi:hypothetical protein